jgi:hypothetical protein
VAGGGVASFAQVVSSLDEPGAEKSDAITSSCDVIANQSKLGAMTWWPIALVLLIAFIAFAAMGQPGFSADPRAGAYASKKPLSEPEQVLFWRLREALPECVVFGQVSFSRFLDSAASDPRTRRRDFNAVSQRSVDFLVCLADFTIVAAVELDDGSHSAVRDERRDVILKSAGVPIVRFHVRDIPSTEDLRSLFLK